MITAKRIEKVISALREGENLELDMAESFICDFKNNHPCGTPACIAGSYYLLREWDGETKFPKQHLNFRHGAEIMANDLGFSNANDLLSWGNCYPSIWGNCYGKEMFHSAAAYLGEDELLLEGDGQVITNRKDIIISWNTFEDSLTMKKVIKHWEGLLRRFIKYEESQRHFWIGRVGSIIQPRRGNW